MKGLIKILVLAIVVSTVVSCNNNQAPNYQYFPNMYQSSSYETYGAYEIFPGEQSAMLPVDGTIARGYSLFDFGSSVVEFERAKVELMNPLDSTQVDFARGKELYDIYCGICHGTKGDGQGNLVKKEILFGIPSYDDAGRDIKDGGVYHTIYYGKNAMGSHKNQLKEEERWQVVAYVMKLKADLTK